VSALKIEHMVHHYTNYLTLITNDLVTSHSTTITMDQDWQEVVLVKSSKPAKVKVARAEVPVVKASPSKNPMVTGNISLSEKRQLESDIDSDATKDAPMQVKLDKIPNEVAKQIQAARAASGKKRDEIATALNIPKADMATLENGTMTYGTAKRLLPQINRILGTSFKI
jgi:ribosome-binding protein aMBF1 (putative translation factor)